MPLNFNLINNNRSWPSTGSPPRGYSSAWAGESSAWVYFPAVLRCTHAQPRTKPTHAVGRENLTMVRNLLPVNSYPCSSLYPRSTSARPCWIFYPRSTLLLNQATATPQILMLLATTLHTINSNKYKNLYLHSINYATS